MEKRKLLFNRIVEAINVVKSSPKHNFSDEEQSKKKKLSKILKENDDVIIKEINDVQEQFSVLMNKLDPIEKKMIEMDKDYKKFLMMSTKSVEEENERLTKQIIRIKKESILDILDVLNDLIPFMKEDEVVQEGTAMYLQRIEAILKNIDIEEIKTGEGDAFDPEIHNGRNYLGTDNAVVEKVLKKGYREISSGKIIRFSEVMLKERK